MKRLMALSAVCVLSLAASLAQAEVSAFPEGLKGFKGTLTGTVKVVNAKNFQIKVTAAAPVEGNKAATPAAAVDKQLEILPNWSKVEGKWQPKADQLDYIKTLKVDQAVTITVINDDKTQLHLTEVPAAAK